MTAPRDTPWGHQEGVSFDIALSSFTEGHQQSVDLTTDPDHTKEQAKDGMESESGIGSPHEFLSELIESKEVLKQMGLCSSATDSPGNASGVDPLAAVADVLEKPPVVEGLQSVSRVHRSQSSNGSSSSITEWDFSGQAPMAAPLLSNVRCDDEAKDGSLPHESINQEPPGLLDTTDDSTDATPKIYEDEDNLNASKCSSNLAAVANEMTDMLRSSFRSRQGKHDTDNDRLYGSSSQSESESSEGSMLESLKNFSRSFDPKKVDVPDRSSPVNQANDKSSTPTPSDHDVELPEEEDEQESPVDDQENVTNKPPQFCSMNVEVSGSKSVGATAEDSVSSKSDTESRKSEDDINVHIQSFRKRNTRDTSPVCVEGDDAKSHKGPKEDPAGAGPQKDYSSFVLGYSMLLDQEYENSDSEHEPTADDTARRKVPNPFFDDSSEDEEFGLPAGASPLSIENAPKDDNEESSPDNGKKQSWCCADRCRKILCFIATVVVLAIIAGVVSYVMISRSKNDPPGDGEQPNGEPVKPPSIPQTSSPPTQLPTPLPTINGIPTWVQVGGDLVGEEPGDEAGFSVAVSEGDRVVVGARRTAKDGMKNRGAARIFQFDSNTGFYVPVWDIYGEAAGDQCGFSVSMSRNGRRVAVGCLGSDVNGQNSGQVRIFDENELLNRWDLAAELNGEAETSLFGASVSFSEDGSSLVVGAPYYSEDADRTRSGRAYVYREVQELKWEQVGEPMVGTSNNDLFGWSVSHLPNSLGMVAVGAPRLDGSLDSGSVRVFSYDTNGWSIIGEPMSLGIPGDRFGFSISLAGDDTLQRIAIGSPGMDHNGAGSGMACIYENNNGVWQRIGDDLVGDGWGENLGYAVSMTPDGTRAAVGVPNKKLDGLSVGQVQVVDVSTSGNLRSAGHIYGRDSDMFGVSVAASYDGKLVYGGASAANLVRIYGDIY
jgi:hypothetical protein